MSNRVIMYMAGAVAILAFATATLAFSTGTEAFVCTADARLDAPDGWAWQRDGANECAWTLYNGQGNVASDDVYEAAGVEPPPNSDPDRLGIVAFITGVLATGASIIAFSKSRAERREAAAG